MISQEQVIDALQQVMHPEMARSLVALRMIRDVRAEPNAVSFKLLLPFAEVPFRDDLIHRARQAVEALDPAATVEIQVIEMDQQERAAFMARTEGGPKPAQTMNQIDQVIAVLSGKGGVGKSSVAALLAVAMRRRGKRVGVLDADITGPSIPKLFGLHDPPPMGPVGILPARTSTGIEVMSINLLLPSEDDAVIWRGPLISGAIKQFWEEVVWGKIDYLIVDLPPGTSDASLTVMQSIPLNGIVLVTSPQDLAGMVVRKAARMAQQMKAPVLGLVENMSYLECPSCGERIDVFGPSQALRTAMVLGVPMLGQLALDPELSSRGDAGQIEAYAADAFASIAERITSLASARPTTPMF